MRSVEVFDDVVVTQCGKLVHAAGGELTEREKILVRYAAILSWQTLRNAPRKHKPTDKDCANAAVRCLSEMYAKAKQFGDLADTVTVQDFTKSVLNGIVQPN